MRSNPEIEVEITFLARQDGGRRVLPGPPWNLLGYMPHLTVGEGDHLGVRFVAGLYEPSQIPDPGTFWS